jgi:hypothetical protein
MLRLGWNFFGVREEQLALLLGMESKVQVRGTRDVRDGDLQISCLAWIGGLNGWEVPCHSAERWHSRGCCSDIQCPSLPDVQAGGLMTTN